MRRQLMCVVAAAAVMMGMVITAQGAEGTLSVTLDYGDEQVHDAALTLYWVGSPADGGYRLTETFGGGFIREEDIQSPELVQWLAETAHGIQIPRILDADGNAFYSALTEGLYLLEQTEAVNGFQRMSPFLVPIPCYGQWNVTAVPKVVRLPEESPKTGQHPAPIIGAMGMVLSGLALVMCADKFRRK